METNPWIECPACAGRGIEHDRDNRPIDCGRCAGTGQIAAVR